jgi:oxygen-independent coproporphyrinogen-3 oxidase
VIDQAGGTTLDDAPTEGSPYRGYAYAYPHKTAYRPLEPAVELGPLWAEESRDSLFLYLHIPFCGMRCGYCNLFTRARPDGGLVAGYMGALRRQAARVRAAMPDATFARFAMGGGTPTYLDLRDLEATLDMAERAMGADLAGIPGSVEVSPGTVDAENLGLLRDRGIDRISIGVETFDEAEAAAVSRPQPASVVQHALDLIRRSGTPTLNIDLIYGLPGQSVASWLGSVRSALRFAPEELYLYPLYVRPLTGLGRSDREWDDLRIACYREARALLLGEGYRQSSMRMFRAPHAPDGRGPAYRCQEDGMVGLGCGARSYTRSLHYGWEYAVGGRGIRAILDDYIGRSDRAFGVAGFGCRLDADDRRRRHVIQSLLSGEGLDRAEYASRFGADPLDHLPALSDLRDWGLAACSLDRLELTESGLERSDAIGPWLYSDRVRRLMEEYPWR